MSQIPTPADSATPATVPPPLIAKGGTEYRVRRYILALFICGWAGWFAYDGWFAWPAENVRYQKLDQNIEVAKQRQDDKLENRLKEQRKDLKFHEPFQIKLQKALAIGLPLLAGLLVGWAHYNSRGKIVLFSRTLNAPGHPSITLDDITSLDKTLWDRKDIAYVNYAKGQTKGKIRLDAFVYQTDPIVKIYDRIAHILSIDVHTDPPTDAHGNPPIG